MAATLWGGRQVSGFVPLETTQKAGRVDDGPR
jgi:hypothetical protein